MSETQKTDIQKTVDEIDCECEGITKYLPNVCKNKDCGKNFVVMFSSKTCLPCRRMYPVMKKLTEQGYIVYIYKVEEFENLNLNSRFNISVYPTFVIFNKGKEVKRKSGMPKESWFKKNLKTREEQKKFKPIPKIPLNPYDGL